jgi:hypothetical protein
VLATVLSLVVGARLFIHPFAGFGAPVEQLRAAVFVAAGLLLSGLIGALHRARRATVAEATRVQAAESR